MQLELGNGTYESNSLTVSNQQCTNFWVNVVQTEGALSDKILFGTAGTNELSNTGQIQQVNRGSINILDEPFFDNEMT